MPLHSGMYNAISQTMRHTLSALLLLLGMLASCSTEATHGEACGDTIPMRHARLVTAVRRGDTLHIEVKNPWDTSSILRSIDVKTPVKRAAVYTATHAALLEELGAGSGIGGLFDVEYLSNSNLHRAMERGSILNLGSSSAVSIERVMELNPDLLMPSPYESQGGYGRLEQMGIPILECADYMEYSPLARAEWMRVYGMLFGQEKRADSLFKEVEDRYMALKAMASRCPRRPRLLMERPLSGTWYVPCGGSTTGILYQDAGADYIFSHLEGSGAAALSIEHVLDKAVEADFWLIKSFCPLNRAMLTEDCPATSKIGARLMVCNTQEIPFFEETPCHPDLLLENLLCIFHPELGMTATREYFMGVQ